MQLKEQKQEILLHYYSAMAKQLLDLMSLGPLGGLAEGLITNDNNNKSDNKKEKVEPVPAH